MVPLTRNDPEYPTHPKHVDNLPFWMRPDALGASYAAASIDAVS